MDSEEKGSLRDVVVAASEAYGLRELWSAVVAARVTKGLPEDSKVVEAFFVDAQKSNFMEDVFHNCIRPKGHEPPCVCHCGNVAPMEQKHEN